MARGTSERIFDILMAAPQLHFKLKVGAPLAMMAGQDIYRSEPPVRPGERPMLIFYITRAAWNRFKVEFHVDESKFPMLKGVEIEELDKRPTQEELSYGTE